MSRLLHLAENFNSFYVNGLTTGKYKPFLVQGNQVGLVRPVVATQLKQYPGVFRVTSKYIELNLALHEYEERTEYVDMVLRELRSQNAFYALKGWRDEFYEVKKNFTSEALFKMDRSATCLFGIRNYGIDINGYVRHPELGLCLWMQQRASNKPTWPDKWDNMVGGGISVGHSVTETARKEAMEEASIPEDLLGNLISAGCVSIYFESERGLFPNTEFVFDLELPVDFIPENADGEVQNFELLPVGECMERMLTSNFKTTSAPVMLDFLIRHGIITSENEPAYNTIVELLHVPLENIYSYKFAEDELIYYV